MRTKLRTLVQYSQVLLTAAIVFAAAPANAAIELTDSPLFLTVAVPPNITLTLDDSGSMARAFVPDTCGATSNDCSTLDGRHMKSAYYNRLYYNPSVVYPAPKNALGAELTTQFADAHRNGFFTAHGRRNLSNQYQPTAYYDLPPGASSTTPNEGYMGHNSRDVQCPTSGSTRYCQYRKPNGSWVNTSTRCSNITGNVTYRRPDRTWVTIAEQDRRDNFCRGTHGSRAEGGSGDYYQPVGVPAYYYLYYTELGLARPTGCTSTVADRPTDSDCYLIRYVHETAASVDADGDGDMDIEDQQRNFANWYSFARTRNLATQNAAALAFADLDDDVRVAWQALHTCRTSDTDLVDEDCDGWRNDFSGISNRIRPFNGQHRSNFYRWVSQLPTNDSTPLPAAMQRVGEYYRDGGENSPYDTDLSGTGSVEELSCRRNYHVLMTDGIWNDAISVTGGNVDNLTHNLPESADDGAITQYIPRAPYRDDHTSTLSDLAMYYWVNDLRTTLVNDVLPNNRDNTSSDALVNYWNPRNDPATWQHMVNFTIGLGLTGYLAQESLSWDGNMYGGSYPALAEGTVNWPEPGPNDAANVADLWHAAINSRGQFFSADDPASLAVAFRAALTAITDSSGSSAALSANSTSIQPGNTFVYQAKFDAKDWSGTLLALRVADNGRVNPAPVWDSAQEIPEHGARRIFTFNGTNGIKGVEFTSCANLSAAQQLALNTNGGGINDARCTDRLSWLRGNTAQEVRYGGAFRNRPRTVMGDVINSDPGYVKDIDYGYTSLPSDVPGATSYEGYLLDNADRTAMVYVGANDGHMHGFLASSGVEQFSYIPAGVYENLSQLTDPAYAHRNFVDGAITVGDAYLDSAWKTVLVAGLNGGGKSIYALDVTNPESFSASNVLWEYTEADLGYTFSQPQIGILESGQWVAIFGNGYNSTGGGAYLYIVDLKDGTLIRKIAAADASGDDSNGLSTPRLFDADGDRRIDAVYAGDLQGNLWKFDVSSTSQGSWGVAYGGPLFSTGSNQAITSQPKVGGHPNGGHIVVFGTGRYLGPNDVDDSSNQSFYGIWDNGAVVAGRGALQEQTIEARTVQGRNARVISNNTPDWSTERGWYLDLPASGERVVSTPLIFGDRVIFVSIVPSTDPCEPGGTSWLMEVKFQTGGTFNGTIIDVNNDGSFANDLTDNEEVVVGVELTELGISKTPVLIESIVDPDDPEADPPGLHKVLTGTSGQIGTVDNCQEEGGCGEPSPTPTTVTRRSWIQIR